MTNLQDYWRNAWNKAANSENMFVQMGRSSYTPVEFFLTIEEINKNLELNKNDSLLDAGGGAGWISLSVAPFVKEVYLFDYAQEMAVRAIENTKNFSNIKAYQDDLLTLENTKNKKFTKIIVGSVLQYFETYEQIETIFRNLSAVTQTNGLILFTLNPDLEKKQAHIESYKNLNWEKERIEKSLEIEEKRFWLSRIELDKISAKTGFKNIQEIPVNENLWHSTHMFNYLIQKI